MQRETARRSAPPASSALQPWRAVAVLAALLLAALAGALPAAAAPAPPADGDPVQVTLWWGDGCPRCEEERERLTELSRAVPLQVVEREVWHDAANRAAFVTAGRDLGFEASAVPTTVVGERVWIGWTDAIGADVEATLRAAAGGVPPAPGVYGSAGTGTCTDEDLQCAAGAAPDPVIDVPGVGEVSLGGRSLLASTLIIGFVDGVNPCSLWVISILLTIVVRTASRRRVVAVGATFLGVTATMYALFMAGIYSALTVVGFLGVVQAVVAVAAGVFGAVSVKDYFAFRRGISFTIADSAKPGIYRRVRAAAGHQRLAPALLATAGLGVAVSLLETPCTAGFPVLWAGLLQANGVGPAQAGGLFAAYMVPFLLDEVVVLAVAVATMRAARLTERHGELLKLLAGVTMLALSAAMALDPALMENPVAAAGLFAGAFATAAVVHVVTRAVRGRRAPDRLTGVAHADAAPGMTQDDPVGTGPTGSSGAAVAVGSSPRG